jgi:aryl-alcohol dehydrogenase-like predicted oxidoreductase
MGIGTWAWGDRFYWGYGKNNFGAEDVENAFIESLERGITFFDTAEVYASGRSEQFLGSFVQEYRADHELIIATKFFPYPWRLFKGTLRNALQRSLARLQMEQVDLYQVHWPWKPRGIDTWVGALGEVAREGLARAVGVSNYDKGQTERAHALLAEQGVTLATNQVELNLLNQGAIRSGLLDRCQELGVTLIAYSPMASGVLSGKYDPAAPPPGPRGRRYTSEYLAQLNPLFELIQEVGQGHGGKTLSQIANNWCIAKGAIPIPGAKTAAQARENAGALGWSLTDEEIRAIDKASQEVQVR